MGGRFPNAIPGWLNRCGPANDTGLARSDHIGSVRMFTPAVWMSTVEWFTNVINNFSPETAAGGSDETPPRSSAHFSGLRVVIQRTTSANPLAGGAPGVKKCFPSKWSRDMGLRWMHNL